MLTFYLIAGGLAVLTAAVIVRPLIMNRGDAAVMYCFIFLYISAKGTGIWGVTKD